MSERKDRRLKLTDLPFTDQIPQLVTQTLSVNGTKERRAQQALMKGLVDQPFFTPALLVFAEYQKAMIGSQNDTLKTRAIEKLDAVFLEVMEAATKKGTITIPINDQSRNLIKRIKKQDERLQQSDFDRFRSLGYQATMDEIVQFADKTMKQAKAGAIEMFLNTSQDEENAESWIAWAEEVSSIEKNDITTKNTFLEKLFNEPQRLHGEERFVDKVFDDISLATITDMSFPLPNDQFIDFTQYVAEFFKSTPTGFDRKVIEYLFFESTLVPRNQQEQEYKYRDLLAHINMWQLEFVTGIFFETEQAQIARISEVLHSLPERALESFIVDIIPYHAAYTTTYFSPRMFQNVAQALNSMDPIDNELYFRFHPMMDFLIEYFREHTLPTFKERVKLFGLEDKAKPGLDRLERELTEERSARHRLEVLQEYFAERSGERFLSQLKQHSDELNDITAASWRVLTAGDIHFLPMETGINIIEFDENSVPFILGMRRLQVNLEGNNQNWHINVSFEFDDDLNRIQGRLNQAGELELHTPIEEAIPGLYTLLRHISVLTLHDLVIQLSQQTHIARPPRNYPPGRNVEIPPDNIVRTNGGELPRVQTARQLIENVYGIRRMRPRRVELHKAYLRGTQEYLTAVELYNQAVEQGLDSEIITWLAENIERARRESHKASSRKVQSIPRHMQLQHVTDPLTGEVRFVQTWVVEHTSPRPTNEELASPRLLFERHYSRASALAWMDQLLPWFINEEGNTNGDNNRN